MFLSLAIGGLGSGQVAKMLPFLQGWLFRSVFRRVSQKKKKLFFFSSSFLSTILSCSHQPTMWYDPFTSLVLCYSRHKNIYLADLILRLWNYKFPSLDCITECSFSHCVLFPFFCFCFAILAQAVAWGITYFCTSVHPAQRVTSKVCLEGISELIRFQSTKVKVASLNIFFCL